MKITKVEANYIMDMGEELMLKLTIDVQEPWYEGIKEDGKGNLVPEGVRATFFIGGKLLHDEPQQYDIFVPLEGKDLREAIENAMFNFLRRRRYAFDRDFMEHPFACGLFYRRTYRIITKGFWGANYIEFNGRIEGVEEDGSTTYVELDKYDNINKFSKKEP